MHERISQLLEVLLPLALWYGLGLTCIFGDDRYSPRHAQRPVHPNEESGRDRLDFPC